MSNDLSTVASKMALPQARKIFASAVSLTLGFLAFGLMLVPFASAAKIVGCTTDESYVTTGAYYGLSTGQLRPLATDVGWGDTEEQVCDNEPNYSYYSNGVGGTLNYLVIRGALYAGLNSEASALAQNITFTLRNNTTSLDCVTETKTASDWGYTSAAEHPAVPEDLVWIDVVFPFSGTQCAITPGTTLNIAINLSGASIIWAPTGNYGTYSIWDTDPGVPENDNTRVVSHVPADNELISATTTDLAFEVEYFVNEDDYVDDMELEVIFNNGCTDSSSLVGPTFALIQKLCPTGSTGLGNQIFNFSIESFGSGVATGTVNAEVVGAYDFNSSIKRPWLSFFGFGIGSVVMATKFTDFTVSTSTAFDELRRDTREQLEAFYGSATSTDAVRGICNPVSGNFGVGPCVSFLFDNSGSQFKYKLDEVYSDILMRWPFGYVTLVVTSLQNPNMDVGLPVLTMDVSTTGLAPFVGSEDVVLDPWSGFASTSILSTAVDPKQGKTFRQIVEPGWTAFVYLFFTIIVFLQLLGLGNDYIAGGPKYARIRRGIK